MPSDSCVDTVECTVLAAGVKVSEHFSCPKRTKVGVGGVLDEERCVVSGMELNRSSTGVSLEFALGCSGSYTASINSSRAS